MSYIEFIWDLDDDRRGNVGHIGEHGISKEDVEYVVALQQRPAVVHHGGGVDQAGDELDCVRAERREAVEADRADAHGVLADGVADGSVVRVDGGPGVLREV